MAELALACVSLRHGVAVSAWPRGKKAVMQRERVAPRDAQMHRALGSELLRELVAHLRQNRTLLSGQWLTRIGEAQLLTSMTREELLAEAPSVYDSYVAALESGSYEALQAYARNLCEWIIPRGVETHEVVGIVLLLRDVLARSLFTCCQTDFEKLTRILDVYEPAANRIANTVGFASARRDGRCHRPVARDRPDARQHRRRPGQDEHGRRSAGRHRAGRTPAGLQSRSLELGGGRRHKQASACRYPFSSTQAGWRADRHDSDGCVGRGSARAAQRPGAAGDTLPLLQVIVDVTAMDVMDSFASRALLEISNTIRLRGAALDLEEGLAYLQHKNRGLN